MNTQELKAKIPLQPYCIGRLLIDMPASGDVIWGSGMVGDIHIVVERIPMTPYLKQVREREKELRNKPHEQGGSMLISVTHFPEATQEGTLLQFWKHSDRSFAGYEGYKYVGGYMLQALAFDALEDEKLDYRKQSVIDALNTVKPLPADISGLDGACMMGGFVAGRKHWGERVDASVTLDEKYPALRFNISTAALEAEPEEPQESILKTYDRNFASFGHLFPDSRVIRKRTRSFGVWEAEEMAIVDKDKDGDERYTFTLQASQPKAGMQYPQIDIEMKAAREAYGKLSKDELLALWDAMVESIRVRPVAGQ